MFLGKNVNYCSVTVTEIVLVSFSSVERSIIFWEAIFILCKYFSTL